MNWRQLPNALTVARIGIAPLVAAAIAGGAPRQALALLLVAAVTDLLDGFLARRYGWQSRLGSLLDPLADKILLNLAWAGLWLAGAVPGWLPLVIVLRDAVLIVGALAWQRLSGDLRGEPTWSGKASTLLQTAVAVLLLIELAGGPSLSHWRDIALWTVAAVTVASGVDYVLRWTARARAHRSP